MRAAAVTLLLCAGVAIACTAAWMFVRQAGGKSGPRPEAPVSVEVARVPVTSGELTLVDGRKLAVRIARLHSSDARQRFDVAALREHFTLPEGEPFQCLLELQAHTSEGSPSAGFDVREARVEDERGVALAAFPPARARGATGIFDPLAALVAPPTDPLFVEQRVSVLMWGRAPAGRARFESCCEQPVPLLASDVPAREIQTTLARIRPPTVANDAPVLEAR